MGSAPCQIVGATEQHRHEKQDGIEKGG